MSHLQHKPFFSVLNPPQKFCALQILFVASDKLIAFRKAGRCFATFGEPEPKQGMQPVPVFAVSSHAIESAQRGFRLGC
jgi:hypothetical protein